MAKKNPFKSKSPQAVYDRHIGNDPKQQQAFEEALADYDVARRIYDLRAKPGLSQRELARRSALPRRSSVNLRMPDHQGHSLLMRRRIAAAVDKRVEIRFVSVRSKAPSA